MKSKRLFKKFFVISDESFVTKSILTKFNAIKI